MATHTKIYETDISVGNSPSEFRIGGFQYMGWVGNPGKASKVKCWISSENLCSPLGTDRLICCTHENGIADFTFPENNYSWIGAEAVYSSSPFIYTGTKIEFILSFLNGHQGNGLGNVHVRCEVEFASR